MWNLTKMRVVLADTILCLSINFRMDLEYNVKDLLSFFFFLVIHKQIKYSLRPTEDTPSLGGTGFYPLLFCVLGGESKVREIK